MDRYAIGIIGIDIASMGRKAGCKVVALDAALVLVSVQRVNG